METAPVLPRSARAPSPARRRRARWTWTGAPAGTGATARVARVPSGTGSQRAYLLWDVFRFVDLMQLLDSMPLSLFFSVEGIVPASS